MPNPTPSDRKFPGLLGLVEDVKAGRVKLDDVRIGIRPMVRRLLPEVGKTGPKVSFTGLTKGIFTARSRRALSR